MPEQREQQDDRQRDAEKPKQSTFSKTHDASPLVVLAFVAFQRQEPANSSIYPAGPATMAPGPQARAHLPPVTSPKAPRPILGVSGPDEVAGRWKTGMARTLYASSEPRRSPVGAPGLRSAVKSGLLALALMLVAGCASVPRVPFPKEQQAAASVPGI